MTKWYLLYLSAMLAIVVKAARDLQRMNEQAWKLWWVVNGK